MNTSIGILLPDGGYLDAAEVTDVGRLVVREEGSMLRIGFMLVCADGRETWWGMDVCLPVSDSLFGELAKTVRIARVRVLRHIDAVRRQRGATGGTLEQADKAFSWDLERDRLTALMAAENDRSEAVMRQMEWELKLATLYAAMQLRVALGMAMSHVRERECGDMDMER